MIAFHGDATIKATYLKRVRAHKKADQIIHGTYWENGKGCAVGCTIHSSDHAAYEAELGIPRILARLEDRIFEGMGNGRSMRWPVDFLFAIRVGADLSLIWPKFAVWLLVDKRHGVIKYAKTNAQRVAIQRVADLYVKVIAGEAVAQSEWRAAAAYAAAAAAYATAADAAAYAATYATDAAYATAYAAAADATAYAAAAAWRDARAKSYGRMATKLLALLKAAPIAKRERGATAPHPHHKDAQ